MSLLSRLRKMQAERTATAIPAISATQPKTEPATVARIARIAVATPQESKPIQPMTATETEVQTVRAWLAHINETDPAEIARVVNKCQRDEETRVYVLGLAAEIPKQAPLPDDRRTCQQCTNLMGERCSAAFRGEISADRVHEPIQNMPRRCAGFAPMAGDTDQRRGRERWPTLAQSLSVNARLGDLVARLERRQR